MSGWQDERHVEMLKALWPEGLSCAGIAERLNRAFSNADYSRNAVIGKVHRLKLPGRARPSAPKRAFEATPQAGAFGRSKVRPRYILVGAGAGTAVIEKPNAPPSPYAKREGAFGPLPGSAPVPWTLRAFGQCAWPVGGEGADTLSCGLPCGEQAYCEGHRAIRRNKDQPKGSSNELMRALRKYAA